MTQRSDLVQRIAERKGKVLIFLANHTFSKRGRPLDKAATWIVAKAMPEGEHDPLFDHEPLLEPGLRELG